jgi:DNA-directed RNA polymerase specialized sigma24 family protein
MPLPAPSVRLPSATSSARRIASEAAQSTLLAARRFSPGPTPSPALTAAAWSLVLLWEPRIGARVARAVRRHPILQPTAEDLRQDALTWAHEIALKWDPDRGRSWPGYLKLCLSRRLLDHRRRILIDRQRHTDRLLGPDPTNAGTAHPEPIDPRPDPAQVLADRRRLAALQAAPAATLRQLLTDPAASLPQRGDRIEACGLRVSDSSVFRPGYGQY